MLAEDVYFADNTEDRREQARLQMIEAALDPLTQTALLKAGVTEGARVLEIGPGAGSMVKWLSDLVGESGHVTALDINPRFVAHIDRPNVTIRTGDMMDPPADLGKFDFIYTRYVMMHLTQPVEGASALIKLLKPGGKIIALDPNCVTFRSAHKQHKHTREFNTLVEKGFDVLNETGIADYYFGQISAGVLEEAGFSEVHAEANARLLKGGSPGALMCKESVLVVDQAIRAYAPEHAMKLEGVVACFDDPSFLFLSPTETVTIGMRPDR